MRRIGLAFVLFVALTACRTRGVPMTPPPFPAQCDAKCFVPCAKENGDTGIRINGDPNVASTFDEIGTTAGTVFAATLRQCDVHRKACVQCLDRLERAGVIAR